MLRSFTNLSAVISTICLLLLPARASAQVSLSKTFDWEPTPVTIRFDEQDFVKYDFTGAVSIAGPSTLLPYWVETFAVAGPGQLTVEVVNAEYDNFSADPRADLSQLPESLVFETEVYRQPEGYFGKISCLPMIRSLSGYQRLRSVELRVTRRSGQDARPRFDFANRSVLADGQIYKIAVKETGIHRLSRGFLTGDLGIDLDGVDPRSIRLYGHPGGMLPEVVSEDFPDDLIEQAIFVEGQADGNFDGDDFILFYGEGPDVWSYNVDNDRYDKPRNIYATSAFYYLKIGGGGNGLRVTETNAGGGTNVNSYDALFRFEEEKENALHNIGNAHGSGQVWFGDLFRVAREKDYNDLFNLTDPVAGEPALIRARMGLRATATSRFILEVQDNEINSSAASRITNLGSALTSAGVRYATINTTINLNAGALDFKVSYPPVSNGGESEGYLDFIQLRARRQLRMQGDQISFRDSRLIGQSNATFQLSNANSNTRIWKIGNGTHQGLNGLLSGGSITANASLDPDRINEFVAFNLNASLLSAEAIGPVENQNLHDITNADMLIVVHPEFMENTQALLDHRREFSGLVTEMVTTEQVYNEFSAGKADPAGIRNFSRMVYERSDNLKFLLLVGDGSFDARDIYNLGTNFVPTFQKQGDFTEIRDFPADDYYGIYTPGNNGEALRAAVNVSVGRLPVRSREQTLFLVDKIISYDINPDALGDWRTRMVFVGDDEDGNLHTDDIDGIAETIQDLKPELNFNKLYFDLFPQESLSAGDRYPDITEGLNLAVTRGALAITYLGHGGPRGWGQERVLSIPQIRSWRNPTTLPIFVTATCTFASFDDAEFVSAGEETLLTRSGGAVALLTTTRPVFATANEVLTRNTMEALIARPDGRFRTLGEVIRIAKNETSTTGNTDNVRKFTLLGDPATVVALPTNEIRTTMVNDEAISAERIDTVGALQTINISGEVVDVNGQLMEDFNGLVYPTVYDKPQIVSTLGQDAGSNVRDVEVQRNIIFRGKATVSSGKFTFTFVVPRDINYEFGQGKISYYAADPATRTDAAGFYDQLVIGGTFADAVADDEGPEVEVFMNNDNFVFGGEVEPSATLLVKLNDDLGINVTGNSIGHDLEAVLDDDSREAIVLNDYYEANADDFRSGEVRYPLTDLEPGRHTITVRAWDVANNNATGSTEFIVAADGGEALTRVLNYPNPFTDNTCFQFDHTLVGEDVDVIVQIYTISGRLVKSLTTMLPFSDGAVRLDDCIEWDGRDDYGDQLARGTYLYQVRLRGSESEETVSGDFQKLVILK
ncbi:hypothetical protein CEQ90_15325 [Lewinellaceae bacterium SD302]|nr:hypothetical protein CEQ90_15325 [Lewinellaceae bacterium SD302]